MALKLTPKISSKSSNVELAYTSQVIVQINDGFIRPKKLDYFVSLCIFTNHEVTIDLSVFRLYRRLNDVSKTNFLSRFENINESAPLRLLNLVLRINLSDVERFVCEIQYQIN